MNATFHLLLCSVPLALALSGGTVSSEPPAATAFSFSVIADPRWWEATWEHALAEIRNPTVNPEPKWNPAELIVAVGDIDPADRRYGDFKQVFAGAPRAPLFLPVIGNHDSGDDARYIRDVIIPDIPGCVRRHARSCDYTLDYKNVRIIVIDAYAELGKEGVINAQGREFARKAIRSAPRGIEHVFVCFHEPAFPRSRHLSSSFNASPADRDAFWKMLVQNRDRVRAVFVSHDHHYSRMQVRDPSGAAANDPSRLPAEAGGIYQVDCGAAGMSSVSTVVQVRIEGKKVLFRTVQAARGKDSPFRLTDAWQIEAPSGATPSG